MTAPTPQPSTPPSLISRAPISVWTTGQRPSRLQRLGRYVPESMAHPAKMLPAIAAHAIATYTRPGDLVLDPMCGIGTTLVEAVHQGRHAAGIEYEPRWARLAQLNLDHARDHGAPGTGYAITGDGRRAAELVPQQAYGTVSLLVTSPPYGNLTHGQVATARRTGGPVVKTHHRYSRDPANLAHRHLDQLLDGFTHILRACLPLLRPGGYVVITTRPYRIGGELIDLPTLTLAAAETTGLQPVDRAAALLCGLRGDKIITRASFFQMLEARRHRQRGLPVHAIAHEDVLILRRPELETGSEASALPHVA